MKILFGVLIAVSMVFLLLGAVSVANAGSVSCCQGEGCNTKPVPEPSTFILFGSMLIGALVVKKVITWDS